MPSVKRLMRDANPVRNDRGENQERAEARLAALVGSRPGSPVRRRTLPRSLAWSLAAAVAVAGAGVAGVIVLGDQAPPPMADQPFYDTTADLEERADAIVRATVGATRTVTTRDGITETVATVSVSRVAKGGPQPGAPIEVAYSSTGPEQADGIHDGGDYVLLLQSRDATTWNLVNTTQGYYTVSGNRLTPTADNPVVLSPAVTSALGVS